MSAFSVCGTRGPKFQCSNWECIPISKRCDHIKDCSDGTDELNCIWYCSSDEFRCHYTGVCISSDLRCNGETDCYDKSDETLCCYKPPELSEHLTTTTTAATTEAAAAGDRFDLSTAADSPSIFACRGPNDFRCSSNGPCINVDKKCDGFVDCADLSDEADCCNVDVVTTGVMTTTGTRSNWNSTLASVPATTTTTASSSIATSSAVQVAANDNTTTPVATNGTDSVNATGTELPVHPGSTSTVGFSTPSVVSTSTLPITLSYLTHLPTMFASTLAVNQKQLSSNPSADAVVIIAVTLIVACVTLCVIVPCAVWIYKRRRSKRRRRQHESDGEQQDADDGGYRLSRWAAPTTTTGLAAAPPGARARTPAGNPTSPVDIGGYYNDVSLSPPPVHHAAGDTRTNSFPGLIHQALSARLLQASAASQLDPLHQQQPADQRLHSASRLASGSPPAQLQQQVVHGAAAAAAGTGTDVDVDRYSDYGVDALRLTLQNGPWVTTSTLRPVLPQHTNLPLFVQESHIRRLDDQQGVGSVFSTAPQLMMYVGGEFVWIPADRVNQLVSTLLTLQTDMGPPPATQEQIQHLPTVAVTKDMLANGIRCNICLEDLQTTELVRCLPCHHIYHSDCIVPWLQLNGTCPTCREQITSSANTDTDNSELSGSS